MDGCVKSLLWRVVLRVSSGVLLKEFEVDGFVNCLLWRVVL